MLQWSRNGGGGGGGGQGAAPIFLVGGGQCPPIFQCNPNELVLYIVHTIAYYTCYIAQSNPSKINTVTYMYIYIYIYIFWPWHYLLITLSL